MYLCCCFFIQLRFGVLHFSLSVESFGRCVCVCVRCPHLGVSGGFKHLMHISSVSVFKCFNQPRAALCVPVKYEHASIELKKYLYWWTLIVLHLHVALLQSDTHTCTLFSFEEPMTSILFVSFLSFRIRRVLRKWLLYTLSQFSGGAVSAYGFPLFGFRFSFYFSFLRVVLFEITVYASYSRMHASSTHPYPFHWTPSFVVHRNITKVSWPNWMERRSLW